MASTLKTKLYDLAAATANSRVNAIKEAIEAAQNSANSETKSTAGDKHDTARAMMQLEVEQKSKQLAEAMKLKQALAQFNPESGKEKVALGSLVITNSARYYIAISVGKLELENETYFAVSPISPIAKMMINLKKGDFFDINGQKQEILDVF